MSLAYRKGRVYERLASDYWVSNGYKIVANRFRRQVGECDLICIKDDVAVFVEVKYRKFKNLDCWTLKQRKRLSKVIEEYIERACIQTYEIKVYLMCFWNDGFELFQVDWSDL